MNPTDISDILTIPNITFVLGTLAIIFSVYNYFKNPQVEEDKKASLLAQQVEWEKEATEKRFTELGSRLDGSMTLAQNHIHTVDVKVDSVISSVNTMSNEIVELATIINERIPKK